MTADLKTYMSQRVQMVESGCLLWTGNIASNGYGRIARHGHFNGAHRVFYELVKGPIPEGLVLDHLCRVRHCVNPEHLEPVTIGENVMRGETIMARKAAQTHCHRGHEFTEENTYRHPSRPRSRDCRKCMSVRRSQRG